MFKQKTTKNNVVNVIPSKLFPNPKDRSFRIVFVNIRLTAIIIPLAIVITSIIIFPLTPTQPVNPIPQMQSLPPPREETYIIFVPGLDTYCDGTPYNTMGFEYFRSAFERLGFSYNDEHFLMYSYKGGEVQQGQWYPKPYRPADTGQPLQFSVNHLRNMIAEFTRSHPQAHYLLIGHSLGGRVSFDYVTLYHLENAGPIKGVITLNSPLTGLFYTRIDLLGAIRKIWGSPAVRQLAAENLLKDKLEIERQKKEAARKMIQAGIHVATFGTRQDIVVNPLTACLTDEYGVPVTKGNILSVGFFSRLPLDLFGHMRILYQQKVAEEIVQAYCTNINNL